VDGRVVLVTGAARGIGAESARRVVEAIRLAEAQPLGPGSGPSKAA
jgi:NAD(P)-dependent dehydrogenase (short-subunit alcohol dehydrogenase family)